MPNKLCLAALLVFNFSCKNAPLSEENEAKNKSFTLSLGIMPHCLQMGSTVINGQEILYFADLVSENKIKFYYDFDSLFFEIDLDTLNHLDGTFNDLWFQSLDTIIINTRYSNRLLYFNGQGELFYNVDLSPQLRDDSTFYEIRSGICNEMNLNSLLFACENRVNTYPSHLTRFEESKKFYQNLSQKSLIVKVDSFKTENPIVKTSSELTYQRLIPEKCADDVIPFNYFAVHEGDIYFAFVHSPYVYKLNQHLEITDSILIKHPDFKTYIDPLPIEDKSRDDYSMHLNSILANGSYIDMFLSYKHYLIAGYFAGKTENKIAIIDLKRNNEVQWIDLKENESVCSIPFKDKLYVKQKETPENLKNKSINFSIYEFPD